MTSLDAITQVLLTHINEELMFGEADVTPDENLLESGVLDSINVFGLVQFVRDTFELDIPPQDILIENFGSVNLMAAYVERRRAQDAG